MFYPYLRGLTFDLLALRATTGLLATSKKIVPVIEPVRERTMPLIRTCEELAEAGVPIVVITNPMVGDITGIDVLDSPGFKSLRSSHAGIIRPGYIVISSSDERNVQQFAKRYAGEPLYIVHQEEASDANGIIKALGKAKGSVVHLFVDSGTGKLYRKAFAAFPRVLLRDGFRRRAKNANYPPEESFGDLHCTYRDDGYSGCGDYAIVGDFFSNKGGPAYAVALHLTYDRADGSLWVKHFISDRTETQADPDGKFLEALEKLVAYLRQAPKEIAGTGAAEEFRRLHAKQHFPGLGKVKEIAIRHHLEVMARVIK